jgi:predicted GIY-YIG superfamily endonuclease
MKQLLLFADERPLVERLGVEFFQKAPECPGVYLMRNSADEVLYVGKARNLRKRLGSYRVANPDRMRRRHLRLLRSVARIELHACDSEDSALAKESALLRSLRPRFNKVGTWPSPPRYLLWRLSADGFDLAVRTTVEPGWFSVGPLGAGALPLRNLLLRLLWCGVFPERGLSGMPAGWFRGSRNEVITIPAKDRAVRVELVT